MSVVHGLGPYPSSCPTSSSAHPTLAQTDPTAGPIATPSSELAHSPFVVPSAGFPVYAPEVYLPPPQPSHSPYPSPGALFDIGPPSSVTPGLSPTSEPTENLISYYFEHVRKLQFAFAGQELTEVLYLVSVLVNLLLMLLLPPLPFLSCLPCCLLEHGVSGMIIIIITTTISVAAGLLEKLLS
jgi:hypothetical protein